MAGLSFVIGDDPFDPDEFWPALGIYSLLFGLSSHFSEPLFEGHVNLQEQFFEILDRFVAEFLGKFKPERLRNDTAAFISAGRKNDFFLWA